MIAITKHNVGPSVTLFEKGTHDERAGSDLYAHSCAKTVATINSLLFCTEVPVLAEGQNFSSIRYINPITKILYHKYAIAACKLLYPNVKLEEGSFQQYGETLKKYNREIYQRLMNSKLNLSDENLHRSFISTSYVKQKQIGQTICQKIKEIISREAFLDSDGIQP